MEDIRFRTPLRPISFIPFISVRRRARRWAPLLLLFLLCAEPRAAAAPPLWRGVYFNPLVRPEQPDLPWLCFYPEYRERIRESLRTLATEAHMNLVDIFVCIAYSLKTPAQAPKAGQPIEEWGNKSYLDGVAAFVDDCAEAGLAVELDLASNMWIPYSVDPTHQIGDSPYWPKPDETPWDESSWWYCSTIAYIEQHAKHPENIAFWCMMGNYELGTAEPCLWEREDNPAILSSTEQFVERVWPAFRTAGKRPKAPPIMLPILSNSAYWQKKPPNARLSAFSNLKKWIVDDLALPPDYWVMTTYPFCDPAPDGFSYLKEIVSILGPENAHKLVSTDWKGPGHDDIRDSVVSTERRTGPEILRWHLDKCAQYRFAGWWIWSYQDTPKTHDGIRDASGQWKRELVDALTPPASR